MGRNTCVRTMVCAVGEKRNALGVCFSAQHALWRRSNKSNIFFWLCSTCGMFVSCCSRREAEEGATQSSPATLNVYSNQPHDRSLLLGPPDNNPLFCLQNPPHENARKAAPVSLVAQGDMRLCRCRRRRRSCRCCALSIQLHVCNPLLFSPPPPPRFCRRW